MTLETVTHYKLSLHPHNSALVHITNKATGKLAYYKIRYHIGGSYAINLVDSDSFAVCAETQSKSATDRTRSIILCRPNIKNNTEVIFRDTSILGFEWCFEWQGEKYRWTRESRISNALECRCMRSAGDDVRVAQYLPRGIKHEYFGLLSLLGGKIQGWDGLELVLCMSILMMLDKADESGWIGALMNKKKFSDLKWKVSRDDKEPAGRSSSIGQYDHPIVHGIHSPTQQQQQKHQKENQDDARARFAEKVRHLDATATLHLSIPPSSRNKGHQDRYLEQLFLQDHQPCVPQSASQPRLPNHQRPPSAPRRIPPDDFHHQRYSFMYRTPLDQDQEYHYHNYPH